MVSLLLRYGAVLAVLVVGDAIWLSYFSRNLFRPILGNLLLDQPRWGAAILFYLLYALGVMAFPIAISRGESTLNATLYGALFGLMAYMTYDLTNLATLRAWTPTLAVIDIGWGAVLTGLATLAGSLAGQRF